MEDVDDLQKAERALELLKSISDEEAHLWEIINSLEGYIENKKMIG